MVLEYWLFVHEFVAGSSLSLGIVSSTKSLIFIDSWDVYAKDFATSTNTWPALFGNYPLLFLTSDLVEQFLQVTLDPGFKDDMYFE